MTIRARRRGWLVPLLLVAGLAVVAPACAEDERSSRVVEVVVPLGSGSIMNAGGTVDVMPPVLTLAVGDTLRIRNEDDLTAEVGPWRVAPGKQMDVTFGEPGEFEGLCALSKEKTYKIVVTK